MSPHSRKSAQSLFAGVLILAATVAVGQEKTRYETGDPRGLRPSALRAIRDSLLTVEVPAERNLFQSQGFDAEPFTSASHARRIERGNYRVRYTGIDDYMLLREAEAFHELGIRAWTVDFTGGPLTLWWEYETHGDVSTSGLFGVPFGERPQVKLINKSKYGRLLVWFLPGTGRKPHSERSREILTLLDGHDVPSDGIPFVHSMRVIDGHHSTWDYSHAQSDPQLWSNWNGIEFVRLNLLEPITVEGPTRLLEIKALELRPTECAPPRQVRLTLMAEPFNELESSTE